MSRALQCDMALQSGQKAAQQPRGWTGLNMKCGRLSCPCYGSNVGRTESTPLQAGQASSREVATWVPSALWAYARPLQSAMPGWLGCTREWQVPRALSSGWDRAHLAAA